MKSCDLCGLQEADGEWFAYNEEHNLVVCPVCEEYAKHESDNDKVWQFGDNRRKQFSEIRKNKMIEMKQKGLTYQAIGDLYGISRERVHQVISGYSTEENGKLKQMIFARDNNQCQFCQSAENLIIHHIDKATSNNQPKNLITLCEKCHAQVHFSIPKITKELDKNIAAVELGRKGGSAPHNRPKDYFSKIAKLPRKRKSANL